MMVGNSSNGEPAFIDIVIPSMRSVPELAPLVAEIMATAGTPVRVFATGQPLSASGNRNLGLKSATSPIVIMVDDDMQDFPKGWAARMAQVMKDNPDCMMCSPRLMNQDGSTGPMTGYPAADYQGCEIMHRRELTTACVAIRNTGLLFDEEFIGSGFEDNDYCRQLVQRFPNAQFICIHDLRIVHRNEQKRQGGPFWANNKAYFAKKWNRVGVESAK